MGNKTTVIDKMCDNNCTPKADDCTCFDAVLEGCICHAPELMVYWRERALNAEDKLRKSCEDKEKK